MLKNTVPPAKYFSYRYSVNYVVCNLIVCESLYFSVHLSPWKRQFDDFKCGISIFHESCWFCIHNFNEAFSLFDTVHPMLKTMVPSFGIIQSHEKRPSCHSVRTTAPLVLKPSTPLFLSLREGIRREAHVCHPASCH